jgi:exoribonuclease R
VLAEAQRAAAEPARFDRADATDLELITVDPAGSRDLDQALHLAREGRGYRVHYAIADVAAFVADGGAIDAAARERGETLYFPDLRVPLHPLVLSEGAASLLPALDRPAVLWSIGLDADAEVHEISVTRAMVRSRAQYDYGQLQAITAAAGADEPATLLAEVGARRRVIARAHHAIDLDIPEQQVEPSPDGDWHLALREQLPVEHDNAELSLLTGMCAATLMLDARIGLLRTVPAPDHGTISRLRHAANALGVHWPDGAAPGDVLAALDRHDPRQLALLDHAASLLRGAGYVAFDGTLPPHPMHAGIGAPYAHVTAPLRRLVDRFATEVCVAVHAGSEVPSWARSALPALPELMRIADERAHAVDRAVIDMTEAWLLRDRVGDIFGALVIDANDHAATVMLDDPAVRARCDGTGLQAGGRVQVRLVTADVASRQVRFAAV